MAKDTYGRIFTRLKEGLDDETGIFNTTKFAPFARFNYIVSLFEMNKVVNRGDES